MDLGASTQDQSPVTNIPSNTALSTSENAEQAAVASKGASPEATADVLTTTTIHSSASYAASMPSITSVSTTAAAQTAPPDPATTEDHAEPLAADSPEPPQVFALVGTDSRAGLTDRADFGDFPGRRADVIVLAIRRGAGITMLSVPRDLYVENLCDGGHHRISNAMAGCDERPGLAQLVTEIENVIGLSVDHAAAVDLAGFQEVVDTLGGYEICTEYPLRDSKSGLELDKGCTMADGETTLQWLRSRYTERYRDGAWETVPDVSDLTRNERQQRFLVDLLEKHSKVSNPTQIVETVRAVAPHLTIDDQLSARELASWIWDLRQAELATKDIPVSGETTRAGARVLVPTVNIEAFVRDIVS